MLDPYAMRRSAFVESFAGMVRVSVAALTVYDMLKAIDKEMVIEDVRLIEKRGGKSGHWRAPE